MTNPDAPTPPAGLTRGLAQHILARLGEAGQPPEVGTGFINVGNETYLNVLESEYLRPIKEEGRGSSFKLVKAYFGGGKTHFLHCLQERAWALGFPTAIVGLSPDESPFHDPVRIYASVARAIGWPPADPTIPPSPGIDQLLRTILDLKRAHNSDDDISRWIDEELRRTPVDAHSFRIAVARYLRALLEDDVEAEGVLASFLLGEPIAAAELRPYGVREELRRETGFRFLRSLVQMLRALDAPGLVLAFDELDRNLSFSPKLKRIMADNLRQMIDLCGREALPGLLMLYAVPPEFLENVVPEYVALQQRLASPRALSFRSPQAVIIDLENLDLPPDQLLVAIGERIATVFEVATGWQPDRRTQGGNLQTLAQVVLGRDWDVAHRRSFVKATVAMLYDQRAEGERRLGKEEARSFVERAAPNNESALDDFEDF